MDIRMVPSLRAVPHLSHLVGCASPQMSNLSRGPCSWGVGADLKHFTTALVGCRL